MNFNQNAAVRGWNSFKACWMWIILKMGQEDEDEEEEEGSLSVKSPFSASSICLLSGGGLMLRLSEDSPFLQPLQNTHLTTLGDMNGVKLNLEFNEHIPLPGKKITHNILWNDSTFPRKV